MGEVQRRMAKRISGLNPDPMDLVSRALLLRSPVSFCGLCRQKRPPHWIGGPAKAYSREVWWGLPMFGWVVGCLGLTGCVLFEKAPA